MHHHHRNDCPTSKMCPSYLDQMEEKIFHTKCHRGHLDGYVKKPEPEKPKKEVRKLVEILKPEVQRCTLFDVKPKYSRCCLHVPNSGCQFPKELLKQLSEHKRFEQQQRKCCGELAAPSPSGVELTAKKASNSIPRRKLPGRPTTTTAAARNVDLFNPSYNFNKSSSSMSVVGGSLIDSIRTKIFGYTTVQGNCENEDEWMNCGTNLSDSSMRLPKETRNSLCMASKDIQEKISMDIMPTMTTSEYKPQTVVIPCPINLLCNRGIHIGKCEATVRDKVYSPLCDQNCQCRTASTETVKVDESTSSTTIQTANATVDVEEVLSEISVVVEEVVAKTEPECAASEIEASMITILQLMEPLSKASSEYSRAELPIGGNVSERTDSSAMNGLNGHNGANGELNGCGDIITQNQQKGCWTIGLINTAFRYLTAETFGFKINANGMSLKKKQIWTLEPESSNGTDSIIYLRSHLDKYLAVDSFGNVTCEVDEKDPGCKFHISVSEDGSGRWALKNVVRGYFLGSTRDKLTCTAKVPTDSELWHIHLAARPQVNLRSVGRKRFAHLSENLDEIHVDANIPWGEDTLFTLEFRLDESGKYAIHTCNNKYLSMGGKLVDACTKDCLFSAEYHSGQLALRDRTGAYLSPIGSKAILKTRSNTVTKDELFSLEDSLPQASFVASLNSRFVSVKQGVDVTANQDEISDHETFQLEFDWSTKRWYIRTMQDRYWTLETGGGIQASGDKRSSNALFDLDWQKDGSLAFRANNGRYVITKRSGHLYATADTIDDNCKYFFYLINRPILVLKCDQGFVGFKSASSPKLECNKATYECIQVERGENGIVFFKGQNGKYWHVDSEGVNADSDTQEGFYLELREPTRLCIKSSGGNYLTASKNGVFRLGDTTIENATQWEY